MALHCQVCSAAAGKADRGKVRTAKVKQHQVMNSEDKAYLSRAMSCHGNVLLRSVVRQNSCVRNSSGMD